MYWVKTRGGACKTLNRPCEEDGKNKGGKNREENGRIHISREDNTAAERD